MWGPWFWKVVVAAVLSSGNVFEAPQIGPQLYGTDWECVKAMPEQGVDDDYDMIYTLRPQCLPAHWDVTRDKPWR